MHFKILTLFPEAIAPYLNSSILGRAQASGLIKSTISISGITRLTSIAAWTIRLMAADMECS